jgi:hypothetical protein
MRPSKCAYGLAINRLSILGTRSTIVHAVSMRMRVLIDLGLLKASASTTRALDL